MKANKTAGKLVGSMAGKMVQLGSNQNQIPTADLVQRLFKKDQPVSQNLGTKAIDYSAAPVNADIWQCCLLQTGSNQYVLNENIVIDWKVDGVKFECIHSMPVGITTSTVASIVQNITVGFAIRNNDFRIFGVKSDGTTLTFKYFNGITTVSDGSWYRFRVTKYGNNITVEKTTPNDINYQNVIQSQTLDVSGLDFNISEINKLYISTGCRLCYLNLNGNKWAFGDGLNSNYAFSFNSSKRLNLNIEKLSGTQNVYCHNAIYGYTSIIYIESNTISNKIFAYNIDGTPSFNYHSSFFGQYVSFEYPASKSFGQGYAIKLNSSMLAYDQANTFFDSGNVAIALYKNTMPSKLNSKIYFDHKNGNELLIYSQAKTLRRPINTANKKTLIVGDSVAGEIYLWSPVLSYLSGLKRTTHSFSGRTLSINIQSDLAAQVGITPTLIADKDFLIIEGGFNDWAQNISESTFTAGIASLFAYIRSQNANAPIFVCGPYNWGNPIDDGTTANTAGMTRNSMRLLMQNLVSANSNAYYFDWSLAGINQSDLVDGVHPANLNCAYKIAKLMYDKILTIY